MAYRSRNTTGSRNRLSDRDMLMDILATSKYMSGIYDHAVLESSNFMVRDLFATLQQDEHETAENIFNAMQQQGWYNTGAGRQSGKRSGKQGQYKNFNKMQQAGNMKATSQYAVSGGGSKQFGRRLSSGKGLTANAVREQSQAGLFNARSTWNV